MNTSTVLTDDEVEMIVLSLTQGMGEASEQNLARAIEWAIDARISQSLLELVMNGQILLSVRDEEILFVSARRDKPSYRRVR